MLPAVSYRTILSVCYVENDNPRPEPTNAYSRDHDGDLSLLLILLVSSIESFKQEYTFRCVLTSIILQMPTGDSATYDTKYPSDSSTTSCCWVHRFPILREAGLPAVTVECITTLSQGQIQRSTLITRFSYISSMPAPKCTPGSLTAWERLFGGTRSSWTLSWSSRIGQVHSHWLKMRLHRARDLRRRQLGRWEKSAPPFTSWWGIGARKERKSGNSLTPLFSKSYIGVFQWIPIKLEKLGCSCQAQVWDGSPWKLSPVGMQLKVLYARIIMGNKRRKAQWGWHRDFHDQSQGTCGVCASTVCDSWFLKETVCLIRILLPVILCAQETSLVTSCSWSPTSCWMESMRSVFLHDDLSKRSAFQQWVPIEVRVVACFLGISACVISSFDYSDSIKMFCTLWKRPWLDCEEYGSDFRIAHFETYLRFPLYIQTHVFISVLPIQANAHDLSPFIDNRCNTFTVEDMLRCDTRENIVVDNTTTNPCTGPGLYLHKDHLLGSLFKSSPISSK